MGAGVMQSFSEGRPLIARARGRAIEAFVQLASLERGRCIVWGCDKVDGRGWESVFVMKWSFLALGSASSLALCLAQAVVCIQSPADGVAL